MKRFFPGWRMALIGGLLLSEVARAYPPAPDILIYGLVKDQYGVPLANTGDLVILQTPGGTQVTTTIQPNLAIGINYAIQVPMDAGTIPPTYVTNALTSGTQYKLYVAVGGVTNLPMEMAGAYLTLGNPSQQVVQNLTLGADANGDGIPDSWELAFLNSIGVNLQLANINPNAVYTKDGRTLFQEYLLGNYPYNPNAFQVTLVSQTAGSAVLAFTTTAGRTYAAYGSADLKSWTPLSFSIPAIGTNAAFSYYSTTIQPLQISTVQPANGPQIHFFRLQLH